METISRFALTFILNSLWQVTMLVLIASACSGLMRRSPARYRHMLWVTTLAFSVLLPLWSIGSPSIILSWSQLAVAEVGEGGPMNPAAGVSAVPGWLADFFRGRSQPVSFAPSVASLLAACYLLFLLYRVMRLLSAWRKTKEVTRTARACSIPDSITAIADECQTVLGLKATTILCSSTVEAPLTLGTRRPIIILPEGLLKTDSSGLAPTELLTTALGHEMAHIRRRDFLWNLIYELIHLPLSFHPAASYAKRRIKETRELVCDEMVTERLMSANAYARSLVHMAVSLTAIEQPTYLPGIFDADNLEERIMRLTKRRPRASARLAKTLLIAAILALGASAIAASAFSLSIGQDKNADATATAKSLSGLWVLYPRTDGQPDDSKGIIIMLESNGGRLSGVAIVAAEVQDAQGNPVKNSVKWPLIEPQFDGANFSFKVGPPDKDGSGSYQIIEGKMRLAGGDFIGRWTSADQAGDLKMIRKKE
jgi:beta-lactamase regulating signal transducer with metallopeptidase domain